MKNLSYLKKYFKVIIFLFIFNFNISYTMENFKQKNINNIYKNKNNSFSEEESKEDKKELIKNINYRKNIAISEYSNNITILNDIDIVPTNDEETPTSSNSDFIDIITISSENSDKNNSFSEEESEEEKKELIENINYKRNIKIFQEDCTETINLIKEIGKTLKDINIIPANTEDSLIFHQRVFKIMEKIIAIVTQANINQNIFESANKRNYSKEFSNYFENHIIFIRIPKILECVKNFKKKMNSIKDYSSFIYNKSCDKYVRKVSNIYIGCVKKFLQDSTNFIYYIRIINFLNNDLSSEEKINRNKEVINKIFTTQEEMYDKLEEAMFFGIKARYSNIFEEEKFFRTELMDLPLDKKNQEQHKKQQELLEAFEKEIATLINTG